METSWILSLCRRSDSLCRINEWLLIFMTKGSHGISLLYPKHFKFLFSYFGRVIANSFWSYPKMAASCILLPRWGTGTPLGHKYPVGACPLARGGTGSLWLEFFFCVSTQIKLADRTKERLSLKTKKAHHLFGFGDSALLFSSILKILPIKDTLFPSVTYLFGVDTFYFSKTNRRKSHEKMKSKGVQVWIKND